MNKRQEQDFEAYCKFFKCADGHVSQDASPTRRESRRRVDSLREQMILRFGEIPIEDEALVLASATEDAMRAIGREWDDLSQSVRESWVRAARVRLASIPNDVYSRLADASAIEQVGKSIHDMSKNIADNWIRAARIAIHTPARFWDECYVDQNRRGMEKLLGEL